MKNDSLAERAGRGSGGRGGRGRGRGGIKSHKKNTRGMTKASGSADLPSKMKDSNPVSDTGVPTTTTTKPSQGAKAAARSAGQVNESSHVVVENGWHQRRCTRIGGYSWRQSRFS
jgi:hypothetical protein